MARRVAQRMAHLGLLLFATTAIGVPVAFHAKPAHAASAREEAGGQRKTRTGASSPLPGNREVALAPAVRPGTAIGLPEPLAASDAARLRRIFDFQARGDAASAGVETEFLQDRRLVGHVLADRWLRRIGPVPEPAGRACRPGWSPAAPARA